VASSGTVKLVVEYVDKERTDGGGRYILKCRFPDRVLTSKHNSLSMTDIGLVPSGTLFLCAPTESEELDAFGVASTTASTSVGGGVRGFFVWAWVTGFVSWLVGLVGLSSSNERIAGQPAGVVGTSGPATASNENARGTGNNLRGVRTLHDGEGEGATGGDEDRKRNEYFGGDSTVFQGRDKDDE
jgi:hypothetical protein